MPKLLLLLFSSRAALIAENLFLRRQVALFLERKVKPRRRTTKGLRLWMVTLSRFFDWRGALVVVQPETFLKWHRTAFRAFWRWKSRKRRGRPQLAAEVRRLVLEMAQANSTWGEERIANELKLKIGILVSPRTIRKYFEVGW